MKGEDAFDDEELGGCDELGLVGDTGVVGEVVDGAVDWLAVGERADVFGEESVFDGVGVVEVLESAVVVG